MEIAADAALAASAAGLSAARPAAATPSAKFAAELAADVLMSGTEEGGQHARQRAAAAGNGTAAAAGAARLLAIPRVPSLRDIEAKLMPGRRAEQATGAAVALLTVVVAYVAKARVALEEWRVFWEAFPWVDNKKE
jgi:hypothetical protein